MFGSDVIEALIGLFLVFFLFSALCSAVNEWVVGQLIGLRSKTLAKGIARLLGKENAKQFFGLSIVKSLAGLDEHKAADKSKSPKNPSYLSSHAFVDGLFELLARKSGGDLTAIAGSVEKLLAAVPKETVPIPSISPEDSNLEKILRNLIGGAKDVSAARTNIEIWFNEGMERATGWYKRRVQWSLLGCAVVVTVLFNLDTLKVMRDLMNNSKLRAALVASAEQTVKTSTDAGASTVQDIEKKIKALQLPIGWGERLVVAGGERVKVEAGWVFSPIDTVHFRKKFFQKSEEWYVPDSGTLGPPLPWQSKFQLQKAWLGWLITAIALSLGAPFWFDLMNKVINLRAAGRKPEEKKEDKKEG
jgi:hypothetical protein